MSELFKLGNESYPNYHQSSPSTSSNYVEPHFDSNHCAQPFQSPNLLPHFSVPFENYSIVDVYARPSIYGNSTQYFCKLQAAETNGFFIAACNEDNNSVYNDDGSSVTASSTNNLQNGFQWSNEHPVYGYNAPEIYAPGYTSTAFYTPAPVAPTLEETYGFILPPGNNPPPASGFENPAGVPRNSNFSYASGYSVVDEAEVFEEAGAVEEDEVAEESGAAYYFGPNSINANSRGT